MSALVLPYTPSLMSGELHYFSHGGTDSAVVTDKYIDRQADRQTDYQAVDRKPGSYIPQVVLNIHWKD